MKVNTCFFEIKCLMEHECVKGKWGETRDVKDEGKRENSDRNLKETPRWCKKTGLLETRSA